MVDTMCKIDEQQMLEDSTFESIRKLFFNNMCLIFNDQNVEDMSLYVNGDIFGFVRRLKLELDIQTLIPIIEITFVKELNREWVEQNAPEYLEQKSDTREINGRTVTLVSWPDMIKVQEKRINELKEKYPNIKISYE